MKSITITATEAARSLSEVLNQVRYQGRRFDVRRGKEVVAQIVPPRPAKGVPIAELNQIFANLPKLGKDEAEKFVKDLQRKGKMIGSHDLIIASTALLNELSRFDS